MDSILILGGSNTQLSLIKKAKARGLKVILADYLENPPGAAYSDIHERISTFDTDACLEAARRHHISAVATTGTDQPVYTAAVIAEKLGLPSFISVEAALASTNKMIMKQRFENSRVPNARHMLADGSFEYDNLKGFPFPVVIKPVDSQGQRGVFKLDSAREVMERLEESLSFSRDGICIIEEYCGREEITSMGFLTDGGYRQIITTKRNTLVNGIHIGVCSSHLCPAEEHFRLYDEIKDVSSRASEALGIKDGPVYIQMLVTENGIIVNELAARVGGGYEDVMIPYITGFDILEAVLDGALGVAPTVNITLPDGGKYVSNQLFFTRPGRISKITPRDDLKDLPFVISVEYNYAEGQAIGSIDDSTARFGHCCVTAGSLDELERNVSAIYDRLEVLDESGDNILIRGTSGQIKI